MTLPRWITTSHLRKVNVALSVLLGTVICLRHGFGLSIPLPVVTLLSLAVSLTAWSGNIKVAIPLVSVILVYGTGLAFNFYPEPWLRIQRFMAFVIGLICFSPLLQSDNLLRSRALMAKSLYVVLSVMVVVSLLIWIGLVWFGDNGVWTPEFYVYGFRGVFDMGMTLSPIAAVVAIISFAVLIHSRSRWKTSAAGIMSLVGTVMCVAGGSRAALGGLAAALLVSAILNHRRLAGMLRQPAAIAVTLCGLFLLAVSMPSAIAIIRHKNAIGESHNSMFYSREQLWNNRIAEITASPVMGIGYANEYPVAENNYGDLRKIEPGSSWLSLLSYGGIIGAGCFLWFFISLVRRLCHARGDRRFPLLSALLIFLAINAVTEGWMMFAGGLMFPVFWLTASAIWAAGESHANINSPDYE